MYQASKINCLDHVEINKKKNSQNDRKEPSSSGQGQREKKSHGDSPRSIEPDVGLDLRTLKSGPEMKSRVGRLTN